MSVMTKVTVPPGSSGIDGLRQGCRGSGAARLSHATARCSPRARIAPGGEGGPPRSQPGWIGVRRSAYLRQFPLWRTNATLSLALQWWSVCSRPEQNADLLECRHALRESSGGWNGRHDLHQLRAAGGCSPQSCRQTSPHGQRGPGACRCGCCLTRGLHCSQRFPVSIRLATGLIRPRKPIPWTNLAGDIEAVGKAVTQFKPGDQVFAATGAEFGAHAEYLYLPEDGALAAKPANVTYAEAAAICEGG